MTKKYSPDCGQELYSNEEERSNIHVSLPRYLDLCPPSAIRHPGPLNDARVPDSSQVLVQVLIVNPFLDGKLLLNSTDQKIIYKSLKARGRGLYTVAYSDEVEAFEALPGTGSKFGYFLAGVRCVGA